jgi:hypothetical protein
MSYMNYLFSSFRSIHYAGGDGNEITYNVINVSREAMYDGLI